MRATVDSEQSQLDSQSIAAAATFWGEEDYPTHTAAVAAILFGHHPKG